MKVQSRLGVTVAGISPGHVAVTVNDGDTVNFTASGTDNQTITAEVKISATAGNIISANVDGIYASASGADNWGSQVIEHDGLSISSGDGTALDPLLVTPLTSVTYAQLAALISGSDLIPGHKYLITDYATVHTIPGTADTNTGATEPLIVTALAVNDLEPIAYSTVHKDDIIYYDYVNNSKVKGSTKGCIYRRIDTVNNSDIPFDWREVKFRRWQIDVDTVFDIGATYAVGDVVLDANNTTIWISLINGNIGNTPLDTDGYWRKFERDNLTYVSPSSVALSYGSGTTLFTIPVTALYQDILSIVTPVDVKIYYKRITALDILESNNSYFGALTNCVITSNDIRNNHFGVITDSNIDCATFSNNSALFFNRSNIKYTFSFNSLYVFNDNIIIGSFSYNSLRTFDYNNVFGIFTENRQGCNYSGALSENIFNGNFTQNHLDKIAGSTFRYNQFHRGTSVTGTSFLSATHVFLSYTKDIVLRSGGTNRLTYLNGADTIIFSAVDA